MVHLLDREVGIAAHPRLGRTPPDALGPIVVVARGWLVVLVLVIVLALAVVLVALEVLARRRSPLLVAVLPRLFGLFPGLERQPARHHLDRFETCGAGDH